MLRLMFVLLAFFFVPFLRAESVLSFGEGADYKVVDLNDSKHPLRFGLMKISTGKILDHKDIISISLPAASVRREKDYEGP